MPIFQRRPNPPNYANYRAYKPLLREDFQYRCAYCLLHEGQAQLGEGFQNFQIDHFRPRNSFPELINVYDNLCYACRWCNRAKWQTWPTEEQLASGYRFVDPCAEDLYKEHARLIPDTGKLQPKTRAGDYTIREIRLNRGVFTDLRRDCTAAQEEIEQTRIKVARLKREAAPQVELIEALEKRIETLEERYINPKVPYEAAGLLVEN
jgi:HNH endonuclease